jgi:ComF family protein
MRFAGYYEGPLRQAVHRLKFSGERYLAPHLGVLMAEALRQSPLSADALVPVPLHPADQAGRGYNQSLLLAREAGMALELPVLPSVLVKRQRTVPQVGLRRAERMRNVAGAFEVTGYEMAGLRILLVDDVCTTGATLAACATALRQGGAAAVYGLVLAHPR